MNLIQRHLLMQITFLIILTRNYFDRKTNFAQFPVRHKRVERKFYLAETRAAVYRLYPASGWYRKGCLDAC